MNGSHAVVRCRGVHMHPPSLPLSYIQQTHLPAVMCSVALPTRGSSTMPTKVLLTPYAWDMPSMEFTCVNKVCVFLGWKMGRRMRVCDVLCMGWVLLSNAVVSKKGSPSHAYLLAVKSSHSKI